MPHFAFTKLLDQELTSYNIATHIVVLIVVEVKLYKKARGSVVSNRMRMKFDRIVLQVNTHRG